MLPNPWRPWELPVLRSGNEKLAAGDNRVALFRIQTTLRPMRIMIDANLRDRLAEDEHLEYLHVLLQEPNIEYFWYSSDGPPDEVTVETRSAPGSVYPTLLHAKNWVLTSDALHDNILAVHHAIGEEGMTSGVWKEDPRLELAQWGDIPPEYEGKADPWALMHDDVLSVLIAEQIRADLYISDRSSLHHSDLRTAVETTIIASANATPLVGLYLRSCGVFRVSRQPWSSPLETMLPRWFFYWAASSHVLRRNRRWNNSTGSRKPGGYLITSLHHRVASVLQTRDELLQTIAVPSGNQSSEDAASALVELCLWLSAAFDASALVVDKRLGPFAKERNVAWQRKPWRDGLAKANQSMADLFDEGSEGLALLDIIHEIRNSIHGEALSSVIASDDMSVGIPPGREERIAEAAGKLGGMERWGLTSWQHRIEGMHGLYIHPGKFEQEVTGRSFALLRQVLDLVDNGEISSVASATDSSTEDEEFDRQNPFHGMRPQAGRRILWQLGL